jgi:hypothetical protein
MSALRYFWLIIAATMLLLFTGCGDDDDDGPSGLTTGNYVATILSFGLETPVGDVMLTLLDNATGEETTTTATSDQNGQVTIEVPVDEDIGFKASAAGYWDTYQFNLDPEAEDEILWIVSDFIVTANQQTSGLQIEAGKSVVAGATYYIDEEEEIPVGCAKVATDPAGEILYFEEVAPDTFFAVPNAVRAMTNPKVGYFLAANIPVDTEPQPATMTAYFDEATPDTTGTVELFGYPDAICISNIYCDEPTPGDCQ